MKKKTIELELRAEIQPKEIDHIKNSLEKISISHSHTKRLSFMCFGSIEQKKIGIRVRIAGHQSEIAIKFGLFGARNRVEIIQPILPEQFIGFVKIFGHFNFKMKVSERETFNYILKNGIIVSIIIAGTIIYIEFKKMSLSENIDENTLELEKLAEQLNLNLLRSESKFDELCDRLDKEVDWSFNGSENDYNKLGESLRKYTNNKH
ncbi:MAG: hypothetical protein WC666_01850 [Candidatus Paceibacterota bacterium]|jgi:hypothetical protein